MQVTTSTIPQPTRQFPWRLVPGEPILCEWLTNTEDKFSEPFFDETINRLRYNPINQRPFTSCSQLEMIAEWASTMPAKKPAAFIFHVSRCGSTLLAQLLDMQPEHMVLAEVPFLDELLRLPLKNKAYDAAAATGFFDAALQWYIQCSYTSPSQVFVKTDSWHLHFYEQLRAQYPKVPFILLYRDPPEVLQSQQRRRGIQSVPGLIEPALFSFTQEQATEYDLDKYMGHVLQGYFKKMAWIAEHDNNSILINYNEESFALSGMKKILAACHLPLDKKYAERIAERAGYHAKHPQQLFSEEKMPGPIPAFLLPVMEWYFTLEALRVSRY